MQKIQICSGPSKMSRGLSLSFEYMHVYCLQGIISKQQQQQLVRSISSLLFEEYSSL